MRKILLFVLVVLMCAGVVNALRIGVTSTTYTGNLGGIAGADQKCQQWADANGYGGTWKALIGLAGVRDLTHDWPLQSNTTYYKASDGLLVDTIGSNGCFTYPLNNPIAIEDVELCSRHRCYAWTGLNDDCSVGWTCNGWTSSSMAIEAYQGRAHNTEEGVLYVGTYFCGDSPMNGLYCAE